jgi:nucleotide-binding universal stress UspA family protein
MKTFLVPIDFSANADHAASFAIALAVSYDAKIIFFHTTSTLVPTSAPLGVYEKTLSEVAEQKTLQLSMHVQEVFRNQHIKNKPQFELVVKESITLVDALADYIAHTPVSMVIMGTRGETNLTTKLFGSNTSNLIRKSLRPVLAIPANHSYKHIKHIAVATDLEHPEKDIEKIIDLAKLFGATIDLMYIYPVFPPNIDIESFDNDLVLTNLREKFDYPNIQLHFVYTDSDNDVAKGINLFVKAYKPQLLVMYRHQRTWWEKLLDSSYSEQEALETNIPLLTIPIK